jgi:soluble lytic murein transglycosylase-like protein
LINAIQGAFVIALIGGVALIAATALLPDPSGGVSEPDPEPLVEALPALPADPPAQPSEPLPQIADLPSVLSPNDAELYVQAFALQAAGASKRADKVVQRIENKVVLSHVLADRYLREARPNYSELKNWLRQHRSHPDAPRIYRLARQYRPKRAAAPTRPIVRPNSIGSELSPSPPYKSRKNLTGKQRSQVRRLKRIMRKNLSLGYVTKTERMLAWKDVKRYFDRFEFDEARADVAAAWYYQGDDRKAYKLATQSIARSGIKLPIAHWTAGLSAWRMKRYEQSARHFVALAKAPDISGWSTAGAAYWAARAYGKLERAKDAERMLRKAAEFPQTLYGVMARTRLGMALQFDSQPTPLDAESLRLISSVPAGRRALALIEARQNHRAEQELLAFHGWKAPGMAEALLSLAQHHRLPSLALKLSKRLSEGGFADDPTRHLPVSLFPIPPWRSDDRSRIDRALLYAFMRQESDFNTFARSHVGARGLMQIMPATARHLTRKKIRARDLYDPELSVELGQSYLTELIEHRAVRGNLLRMIAAYNSGPGNVNYWRNKMMKYDNDPLLYIETLPNIETRLFVRRVLTNLWIYRYRLEQSIPSLQAMLDGKFPKYKRLDSASSLRVSRQDAS